MRRPPGMGTSTSPAALRLRRPKATDVLIVTTPKAGLRQFSLCTCLGRAVSGHPTACQLPAARRPGRAQAGTTWMQQIVHQLRTRCEALTLSWRQWRSEVQVQVSMLRIILNNVLECLGRSGRHFCLLWPSSGKQEVVLGIQSVLESGVVPDRHQFRKTSRRSRKSCPSWRGGLR